MTAPDPATDPSFAPLSLRAALRPVLRAVLRRPGLVNPVYLRGERIECALDAEVDAACRALGVARCSFQDAASCGTGATVVVCGVRETAALAPIASTLPGKLQVVVWGRESVEEFPEDIRPWLRDGVVVGCSELAGRGVSPVADALDGIEPGESRLVVWIGAPGSRTRRESEAELRLRARGYTRVRRCQIEELQPSGAGPDSGADAAVFATLTAADVPLCHPDRLSAWHRAAAGAPRIVIADDAAASALRERIGPAWEGAAPVVDETAVPERSGWPELPDVLLDPPVVGAPAEGASSFNLEGRPLAEVLQSIESWRPVGVLLVYDDARLGWIEIVHDAVRACGCLGAAAGRLAAVRAMGRWRGARAVFGPGALSLPGDGGGERMSLGAVAFDLMTLGETAPVDDEGSRVGGAAVARFLLRCGLREAAETVLRPAAGGEEGFILAHLLVGRDPEAGARFHRAAASERWNAGASALRRSADLNGLLIHVREGRTAASSALLSTPHTPEMQTGPVRGPIRTRSGPGVRGEISHQRRRSPICREEAIQMAEEFWRPSNLDYRLEPRTAEYVEGLPRLPDPEVVGSSPAGALHEVKPCRDSAAGLLRWLAVGNSAVRVQACDDLASDHRDDEASLPALWLFLHDDPYVTVQRRQEQEKVSHREPLQATAHKVGYPRLIRMQKLRGYGLGEMAVLNDAADLACEFSFGQHLVGVEQTQVRENVPTTRGDLPLFAHFPSFPCRSMYDLGTDAVEASRAPRRTLAGLRYKHTGNQRA